MTTQKRYDLQIALSCDHTTQESTLHKNLHEAVAKALMHICADYIINAGSIYELDPQNHYEVFIIQSETTPFIDVLGDEYIQCYHLLHLTKEDADSLYLRLKDALDLILEQVIM